MIDDDKELEILSAEELMLRHMPEDDDEEG